MRSDNKSTTTRQVLILAVLLAAVVGAFYFLFEIQEEEIDQGYKRPARENPFHAATLFLNQSGVQTTVIKGFKEIEDLSRIKGTIIITDSRKHLSQQFHQRLLNWVEEGGSLMLYAELPDKTSSWLDAFSNDSAETTENDFILSFLGARVYEIETDATADSEKGDSEKTLPCKLDEYERSACVEINFQEMDTPLYAEFMTYSALADDSGKATAGVSSEKGYHLVQYEVGEGLLTLVTDFHFWTNHYIQENDHAFMLELFTEDSEHVWFLSYGRSLSFLEFIWQVAHLLILWLVLALALLLWRKSFRFGPILPGTERSSRKLMEHIIAGGRFLWGKKKESYMIQQLQDYIHRRMRKNLPGYPSMDANNQIEAIHRVTHLTRPEIQLAFTSRDRYTKSEFIKTVKALQLIGKKL